MYTEDDLLPISALRHLSFCERRCALIHVEGQWEDNVLTVEGKQLHDRAHEEDVEMRGNVRLCRGLWLHSLRLGLVGRADLVEFRRIPSPPQAESRANGPPGVALDGLPGRWQPYPVEYKRGRPKPDICDEVQLCAQALCLEEMLQTSVSVGALYYGEPRRRQEIELSEGLRMQTQRLAERLHAMIDSGETPPGRYERKCRSCSLLEVCLPESTAGQRSAARYLRRAMGAVLGENGGDR